MGVLGELTIVEHNVQVARPLARGEGMQSESVSNSCQGVQKASMEVTHYLVNQQAS